MPSKQRRERKKWLDEVLPKRTSDEMAASPFRSTLDGVSDTCGGLVNYDDNGDLKYHPAIGTGANRWREEDKRDYVESLQIKYKEIWGQRGKAKVIALDTGRHERTIQSYFRDFPINAKGQTVPQK